MKAAIANEWLKIRKQKKSKVLFILVVILALVLMLGNLYLEGRTGFKLIESDQASLTLIDLLSGLILPLIAFIMAVDSFSNEMSSGTIKYGFMAPISRGKFFFSKLTALIMYNALILGTIFMISFLISAFTMNGALGLNFVMGLSAYTLTLIPMTLISLWGLLLGMFFSSGLSIAIGIIGVVALNVGGLFLPILTNVSPIGYMTLYNSIIYQNISLQTFLSVLLYVISYYIILIALNLLRINQKEL